MSTRAAHRWTLLGDRDLWQVAAVATAACALSGGLVYLGYLVHVWRTARRAPCQPAAGHCVLLFGKHAPQGRIDPDFAARLDRAMTLWRARPPRLVVLLGGGRAGECSEAEIARAGLFARGLARDSPLQLEDESRDTLQNLRNARRLLAAVAAASALGTAVTGSSIADVPVAAPAARPAPRAVTPAGPRLQVTLLSSRYHLARCALFARQLGFEAELCAAEPRLQLDRRIALRIAAEAGYVCVSDIGTRWARLTGNRRMLARVT